MFKDKDIKITYSVDGVKHSVTIKESVLDLYSLTVTHHQKKYKDNKKAINKTIKDLVADSHKYLKDLDSQVSKFLLSVVSETLRTLREREENSN